MDVTIYLVDFMDARPLPRATLDVTLTVTPRFPVLPDGPGPEQEPRPDDRFAEVLAQTVVTDADGHAELTFDAVDLFRRLAETERDEIPHRAIDAVGTLRSGAALFGLRYEPTVLDTLLGPFAQLEHTLPVDLGMSIVGHTTPHTARLWFYLPFALAVDDTYLCNVATVPVNQPTLLPGPLAADLPGRTFPVQFEIEAHTGVIDIEDLSAGRMHEYALVVRRGLRQFALVTGRFRTPAEAQPRISFAFGSCHLPVITGTPDQPSAEARKSLELWQRLADRKDFEMLLLIGDQIYGDDIEDKWPEDDDFHRYVRRYQQLWAYRPVRQVLRSTPTYMILDDHDVADDFGIGNLDDPKVVGAMRAYRLYQHKHNPGTLDFDENKGPLHYSFRWGPAAFFVMDGRTMRNEGTPVFGSQQLSDLRRWARSAETRSADIIFFVAPVPLALLPSEIIRKVVDNLTEQSLVTAGILAGLALGFLGIPVPFPGVGGAIASAAVLGAVGFAAAEVFEGHIDRTLLLKADLGERWDLRENQRDLIKLLDLLFDLANGVGDNPPRKRAVYILAGDIHAATMHGIRSLPAGNGLRHTANPTIIQLTSSALSHESVNSTLWAEAVSKIDEDLDLDLHDVNLLTVLDQLPDWDKFTKGVIDAEDVFGEGKGEYFLDPNHDKRYITQFAGLLMERTFGMVEIERLDPQRRRYRIRLVIEGQSFERLRSTLDLDLDTPSSPALRLTPVSINFGTVSSGAVRTKTVTIENVAGARVELTVQASQGSARFRWPAFSGTLEHGEKREMTIEFRPASSAIERSMLVVTGAPEGPRGIGLIGKGSGGLPTDPPPPPPRLNVKPGLLNFGSVALGATVQRSFTIENATGAPVTIAIAGSSGGSPFTWQAFNGTLAAGAQRSFSVSFKPVAKAIVQATITITSSAPGSPHRIPLVGKGGVGGF